MIKFMVTGTKFLSKIMSFIKSVYLPHNVYSLKQYHQIKEFKYFLKNEDIRIHYFPNLLQPHHNFPQLRTLLRHISPILKGEKWVFHKVMVFVWCLIP